ncbi:MAG: hypothetical protein IEMM0008_1401 [bacterium]|nr:MAG: hypothetical protein IEMM0008_1401 [bacterium]
MNIVDFVILGVLIIFTYKSYRRGFTGEIFSLVAILLALFVAFKLYTPLSVYLSGISESKTISEVISFAILFIAVNFAVNRLGEWLQYLLDRLYLNWLDSLLGGVVGFTKGFLLVGVTLLILQYLPFANKQFSNSFISPHLILAFNRVFKFTVDSIPSDIKAKGKELAKEINSKK